MCQFNKIFINQASSVRSGVFCPRSVHRLRVKHPYVHTSRSVYYLLLNLHYTIARPFMSKSFHIKVNICSQLHPDSHTFFLLKDVDNTTIHNHTPKLRFSKNTSNYFKQSRLGIFAVFPFSIPLKWNRWDSWKGKKAFTFNWTSRQIIIIIIHFT